MSASPETPQEAARRLAAGALRDGYVPVALHVYTDADDSPLYWRIRAKHPATCEKWIRPMHLNGAGYELGEPPTDQFPDGKPLYGLHALATRPGEPVIVTEGEYKADKLAALGLLVTTSGGAESAGKADWRPLANREVVIWPDHDDAGRRYAEAVKTMLSPLGCTVRVLDVTVLGLPAKGDAADWLGAHPGARAEDVLALATEKQAEAAEPVEVDPWPAPREIKADLPSAPPFDAAVLLPKTLADFVLDEADRMPCAPDYIAATLLVVLGGVIGAKCAIKPKRRDDWIVTPNLYGGIVGDPAVKKTPAANTVMRFLDRLEAREADRLEERMKVYEAEHAAFEAHQNAVKAAMKKAASGKPEADKMHAAMADLRSLEAPEEPHARRFKSNDATTEKLGDLLTHNQMGMLVFRDELIGLLASWDREGREGDRAFYLEGWNGTGSFSIDRIGRGSLFIKSLCLSVFGGIQPDLLERYLAGVAHSLDNDGRIQRFQVLVYPDAVPWEWRDRYPVKGAREAVRDLFDRLASFDPVQDGASAADDFVKLPHFHFDDEAQEVFIEWSTELHRELISKETNPLIQQHLGKFEKLFCAVSLILHLAEGNIGPVRVESALRAAAWCEYLQGHARRIYALVEAAKVNIAKMLGRRIAEGKLQDHFTARDVWKKGWGGIKSAADAEAALTILEDHGWLRSYEACDPPGRPTTRYVMNPLTRRPQ